MKDFVEQYWEKEALPALIEFGKIPNVSPGFAPKWSEEGHMDIAANFLKQWAESRNIAGMNVELLRKDMRTPLIFIEIEGQTKENILMYGHLDKQPPMLPWREGLDPWVPIREGDLLYGRGLADDGYSIFCALGAVEAAQRTGKPMPRVVIVIEASEESASVDLLHYINFLKPRIGTPDVIVTLDAEDRDGNKLWLTQSLRGVVTGFLTVETMHSPMHSGIATGVVPSTHRIMRMLISRIENQETGHIINEIVSPPVPPELAEYAEAIARDVPSFLDPYDLPEALAPSADTLVEVIKNNLVRAGLEVTGISGVPTAEMSGNVMVGTLTARLSVRTPPQVDTETAATELKRVFEDYPPYGAKVTFTIADHAGGWLAKPMEPAMKQRITDITCEIFGSAPGLIGDGASIPFVKIMVEQFPNAQHVLTGILTHASHAHGPNENLDIRKVKKLTEFVARLLVG